ncbi:MAG: metallophosphoesterase [archaeon]|nr:metallophosphoesterase [archaeon]
MKKEIIVLGDIELGAGTLTDDFISDGALSSLIVDLSKREHPIDLVLNGDTLDFLKCPYIENGKKNFPRHITEDVSLGKLAGIYKAHKLVFDALKQFCQKKKNKIFFIIGNHDHDLFFKKVQTKIKSLLKSHSNIYFRLQYHYHNVYAEHGHQLDFLNRINPKRPFLTYRKQKILNIPWISLSVVSKFMNLKEEHPFLERISPYPVLFSHHKVVLKKLSWRSLDYVIKSTLYYPFRYFYDPTYYMMPRELFRELYRRIKSVHWDLDDIVEKFKTKRKRRKRLQNKVHILGHIHKKYIEEKDGWVVIHPDTWRDEYILDEETRKLTPKKKRYVRVEVSENDEVNWEVVEVQIERSLFDFDVVIKDERRYLKKAAAEEGFTGQVF